MFSSLNSVLRNCLKQLRPAALFITLSNDIAQERVSSRVGFGLSSQLVVLSVLLSNVDLCIVSSSFLTVKQEQLQQQHQQKQQAFEALVGVFPILWRAWRTLAAAS